ncbi:MAG: methylmalonyl-CoA mutase family protein [Candidatus Wallbacteria bacterium]|nr:methylmalonyl-CoA mutase family protein [Candidatus Wallbacteria bacterium]
MDRYKEWDQKTNEKIKKSPERKKTFRNHSGIDVKRLYTPQDNSGMDYERDLGYPGEFPFTRGVQPTMYRGRYWTMRQYAGFGTARESNERYRFLISQGQKGLSVAFDLPTQLGYDSDDPLAEGEVGKVGVAVDSLQDMEVLFDGIDLASISTSMTINASAFVIFGMYLALARKRGISFEKLNGTIQNDILKEYIARGTYIFPPRASMRLITDIFSYCSEQVPNWNTISISGYHIREAGSTAVQEVAFTLADAVAYVESAVKAGLSVDSIAPRLSFFFNAHNDFFEEVAKFRAARRMWARIMKERFKAEDPRSWALRFHTQTAGSTLIAQQKDNNIIRVTLQALAAVLGGTQSLHTNSRDEALSLPTEHSVKIALRTQQIIADESGVCDTVDPLGGSYYVESLTEKIEHEAAAYLNKIDSMGGMLRAIEEGYVQREIQDSAYDFQRSIESGDRAIVGLNTHFEKEDAPADLLKVDPAVEGYQKKNLTELKNGRDNVKAAEALEKVRQAALGEANIMPAVVDAALAYVTLGEICHSLRKEWGEYQERVVL